MGWRGTFEALGLLLLVAVVQMPWGSLIRWAKEEIKSKPKKEVL
jgi:hypothetical protein